MKSLDIETIPNIAMIDKLPAPKVAYGNTKDPEKRAVLEAEAKKDQIDKMALNPFYGRLAAYALIGLMGNMSDYLHVDTDEDEMRLVYDLLKELRQGGTQTNPLCTFNGNNFDLPYIYKRAMILRVEMPERCPPLKYWTKRYGNPSHYDLMQELCNWAPGGYTSLDEAASVILGKRKNERDYKTYGDLIRSGNGNQVRRDSLDDALLTIELYNAVHKYLG